MDYLGYNQPTHRSNLCQSLLNQQRFDPSLTGLRKVKGACYRAEILGSRKEELKELDREIRVTCGLFGIIQHSLLFFFKRLAEMEWA